MARISTFIAGLLVVMAVHISSLPQVHGADAVPLQRIAFGSCVKQDKPQPIWEPVVETKRGASYCNSGCRIASCNRPINPHLPSMSPGHSVPRNGSRSPLATFFLTTSY